MSRCHLCGKDDERPLFTFSGNQVVQCRSCGLQYLNPQPSDAELEQIYRENYFLCGESLEEHVNVTKLKRGTAKLYVRQLAKFASPNSDTPKKLLEIGCGRGEFLVEAALAGYSVVGLDYSSSACAQAEALFESAAPLSKHRIICGDITQLANLQETFDCCVLADLLEHVRDPKSFLISLHRLLKPGAILFVAMPSLDSWSSRLLGQRWMEYKPEHLTYFTEDLLRKLLGAAGFSVMESRSGAKILTLKYIIRHFDRFRVPVISPLLSLIGRVVPEFISKRQFKIVASGMALVARR